MFNILVDHITERLKQHHSLYNAKCKAELWEELLSKALIDAGHGSDWQPDYNHKVGVDQVTDSGIKISNKSGALLCNGTKIDISGSRLTSHCSLEDKLEFLSNKTEDYVFCLATDKKDQKLYNSPVYYFIVINSDKLDYKNAEWTTNYDNSNAIKSYTGIGQGYVAKITRSMSDQIWTKVDSSLLEEKYKMVI